MDFWTEARKAFGDLVPRQAGEHGLADPKGSIADPYAVLELSKHSDVVNLSIYFGAEARPVFFELSLGRNPLVYLRSACCGDGLVLKNKRFACNRCGSPFREPIEDVRVSLTPETEFKRTLVKQWLELVMDPLASEVVYPMLADWLISFRYALIVNTGEVWRRSGYARDEEALNALCVKASGPLSSMEQWGTGAEKPLT